MLAALVASVLLTTAAAAAPESKDVKAVQDLENQSWVAWKNQDADFFERFLAADHVEVHSYGVSGKADVVSAIRSKICAVQTYKLGDFKITQVAADSVLLTYRAEQDTQCGAAKAPSPVWTTSLYAKRGGVWVNVMFQQTPLKTGE